MYALCLGATFTQAQILTADFEGSLNADWTTDNTTSWMHGDAASLSSQYLPFPAHSDFMAANDDAAGQSGDASGMLISPVIDLSAATFPVMSFDFWFLNDDYQGADETAKVMITVDGTNWTELSDLVGNGADWGTQVSSLAAYAGNETVQIGFAYDDGGGWNYGFAVDNIVIEEAPGWDIAITEFGLPYYQEGDVSKNLSGDFTNLGANAITSFDLHWSDGTDTYSETITGVNVAYGETYTFTHGTAALIPAASIKSFDVWIDNLNGNMDVDDSNNMVTGNVVGLSFVPAKKMVVEEGTGTWCGWCPRGTIGMDYMASTYPETFIGIAVHNGDPMTVSEYDSAMPISGYPSGLVDRAGDEQDPGSANLEPLHAERLSVLYPAAVDIDGEFNEGSRELSITLTSTFAAPLEGDMRFNLVLTEDGVTGTSSAFAQANYYSGGGNGAMGGYENLPDPVPASEMVYDHVARAIVGGFDGTAGIIPGSTDFNDAFTHTYTVTVSEAFDASKMHAIGFLMLDGEILNANSLSLSDISVVSADNPEYNETLAKVYPNPFTESTMIDLNLSELAEVSVQVYNTVGQLVSEKFYGELVGAQMLPFHAADLADGTYFIHVRVADEVITKRVTKMK